MAERKREVLPEVPVWKRAERFAALARNFVILYDAARANPERAASAREIGEQLAAEAKCMADLMATIAAHPPVPAAASHPARLPFKDDGT